MGDDAAMLEIVSSANIACGFHAGDPLIMRDTVQMAIDRGVVIGAHVSYRDLVGFGRRPMDPTPQELETDVLYQLAALDGIARTCGGRVSYVKPHGALYNRIVHDDAQAAAVVRAVRAFDASLTVLGLPGSVVLDQAAQAGSPTATEAFADRAYTADGALVSRRAEGAVLQDPAVVSARMVRLVRTGSITAITGEEVRVSADSLCTHGDSPSAVALARAVRAALVAEGVTIAPFVSSS